MCSSRKFLTVLSIASVSSFATISSTPDYCNSLPILVRDDLTFDRKLVMSVLIYYTALSRREVVIGCAVTQILFDASLWICNVLSKRLTRCNIGDANVLFCTTISNVLGLVRVTSAILPITILWFVATYTSSNSMHLARFNTFIAVILARSSI